MAPVTVTTNAAIKVIVTPFDDVNRKLECYGNIKIASSPGENSLRILSYHPQFRALCGPSPTHSLLFSTADPGQSNSPLFHEACVFLPEHEELYITSNLLPASDKTPPRILISRIKLNRKDGTNEIVSADWTKMSAPEGIHMANGGVNYGDDGMLICSQGDSTVGTGGIYHMHRALPVEPVVTNFHGRDFNSVNDVVVAKDGAIWFTDPTYGYEQGIRQKPLLPCHIYRYQPHDGDLRVVADGLGRPNGIAFSPDESVAYITDTDHIHGDVIGDGTNPRRAATIYAFDIQTTSGAPFLVNRRVFAYAVVGFPDGIKCDIHGNVYSGCGDGVEVWNPQGTLIGRILVEGGVANFCFGREGELFLCAEQKLWKVQLGTETKGALLRV